MPRCSREAFAATRFLMAFDTATLLVTSVYITALLGGLLLFSWAQTRSSIALAMAGMTFLLIALGIGLLGASAPDFVTVSLAGGVLALSHGLLYSSARVFNRRPPIFLSALIGTVLWLLACEIGIFAASVEARAVVLSLIIGGYSLLLCIEFGHAGTERLPSAQAASALAGAHALFFLGRAALILGWGSNPSATEFAQSWSSIITFETLTASIALAFLFMSMSKERAEAGYRSAARVDYLTGILNRRAFVEAAEETIRREGNMRRTLSLLLFDLDHFKQINDDHGHPIGDRVLQSFCSVVSQLLPAGSLFGRLGGEEFAALVPGVETDRAYTLGDKIRQTFAEVTVLAGGKDVRATTSVGIAASPEAQVGLSDLLSGADAALYVAKSLGRDRVQVHGLDEELVAAKLQRESRAQLLRARAQS